VTAQTRDQFYF